MLFIDHDVFDDATFFPRLFEDLKTARGLVLIQSPYVFERRVDRITESLRQTLWRGVCICSFIRQPPGWNNPDPKIQAGLGEFKENIQALRKIGVHVNMRTEVHEKVVTIDDRILFDGSLNSFSQNRSSERMTRFVDRGKVLAAIQKHKLHTCDVCRAERPSTPFSDDDSILAYVECSVAKYRRRQKLSQRELSDLCGVPRHTIVDVETGKRNVQLKTLNQICQAVGLELMLLDWFLADTFQRYANRKRNS